MIKIQEWLHHGHDEYGGVVQLCFWFSKLLEQQDHWLKWGDERSGQDLEILLRHDVYEVLLKPPSEDAELQKGMKIWDRLTGTEEELARDTLAGWATWGNPRGEWSQIYIGAIHTFVFFLFFSFIFISWRLITLQYCSGFCHTLTWIRHGFTCVPHPEPRSHLPPHPIPLGHPSVPALSTCLLHPSRLSHSLRLFV